MKKTKRKPRQTSLNFSAAPNKPKLSPVTNDTEHEAAIQADREKRCQRLKEMSIQLKFQDTWKNV